MNTQENHPHRFHLILALSLALALSACGGGGEENTSTVNGTAQAAEVAALQDDDIDSSFDLQTTQSAEATTMKAQIAKTQWSTLSQTTKDKIRNLLVTFAATDLQLEGVAREQMGNHLKKLSDSSSPVLQKFVDGLVEGKSVAQSARDTNVLARFSPSFDLKTAWDLFTKQRPCDASSFYDYECKYMNNTMYLLNESSLDMEAFVNALADTKTQQSGWQFILANGPADRDLEIEYRRGMYRVLLQVQRFDKYRAKGEFANATVAFEKLKPLVKTFRNVIDDVMSVKKKKV